MAIPTRFDRADRGRSVPAGDLAHLLPIDPAIQASLRILVVDDERTLRESCASALQVEGYRVETIGRGEEARSEEHTSELQSRGHLVCRLLLEKKKNAPTHRLTPWTTAGVRP